MQTVNDLYQDQLRMLSYQEANRRAVADTTAQARMNRLGEERWEQLKEMIVTTKGSAWFEEDEDTGRKVWAICQEEQIGTRMRRKLVPYNFPAVLDDQDVFVDDIVEEPKEDTAEKEEIETDSDKKAIIESVNELDSPP